MHEHPQLTQRRGVRPDIANGTPALVDGNPRQVTFEPQQDSFPAQATPRRLSFQDFEWQYEQPMIFAGSGLQCREGPYEQPMAFAGSGLQCREGPYEQLMAFAGSGLQGLQERVHFEALEGQYDQPMVFARNNQGSSSSMICHTSSGLQCNKDGPAA